MYNENVPARQTAVKHFVVIAMKRAQEGTKRRGRPRAFDREAALEKAMTVFWRHGYEATSMADLTAAMGINPPSLYAAFGDKERLFLEAIERYLANPALPITCLESELTARGAIEKMLQDAARQLVCPSHPPGCMVVIAAMNVSHASAPVQAALAAKRAASLRFLEARLERARAYGELGPGVDVKALARFYATVLQGMTIQAKDGATGDELTAVAARAMRAWPALDAEPRV